jgi:hypothetical protein
VSHRIEQVDVQRGMAALLSQLKECFSVIPGDGDRPQLLFPMELM